MDQFPLYGFHKNPFDDQPIGRGNLNLFAGREGEISAAQKGVARNDRVIFIEGGPGAGKSSLGNYIRYEKANRGIYITPDIEIDHNGGLGEPYLWAATLLGAFDTLEAGARDRGKQPNISKRYAPLHREVKRLKKWFKDHSTKLLSNRISGTAPHMPFPFEQIRDRLHLCADMAVSMGFKGGIVTQVMVGERTKILPHGIEHLIFAPNVRWILTGPLGSGRRVAGRVPGLTWIGLSPLPMATLRLALSKRLQKATRRKGQKSPISLKIPEYLHRMTDGDLGYTFHLCSVLLRLMARDGLIRQLTLKQASGAIKQVAGEDVKKIFISPLALSILRRLSANKFMSTGGLSGALRKKQTSVSRALSELSRKGLTNYHSVGRKHLYAACTAAKVAYRA